MWHPVALVVLALAPSCFSKVARVTYGNLQTPLDLKAWDQYHGFFENAEDAPLGESPLLTRYKVPGNTSWYFCGNPEKMLLKVDSFSYVATPDDSTKGLVEHFQLNGQLKVDILNTQIISWRRKYEADTVHSMRFAQFDDEPFELCEQDVTLHDSRATCPPVRTGQVRMSRTNKLRQKQMKDADTYQMFFATTSKGSTLYCFHGPTKGRRSLPESWRGRAEDL